MRHLMLITFMILLPIVVWADNIIDDPMLLYQAPISKDSALLQKITINRKINNINELVQRLNNLPGIKAIIYNNSKDIPMPVQVNLYNATIIDLLNQTSQKLGYNWNPSESLVIFSAINPVTIKQRRPPEVSGKSVTDSKVPAQMTWYLDTTDHTLRGTLTKWCKKAGWQLIWNVRADYPIITDLSITGSFEQAVNAVLKGAQHTELPLAATMYDGAKILEIYSPTLSK